jgi:hypothetical protein
MTALVMCRTCSRSGRAPVACQDLIRFLLVIHPVIIGHVLIRRLHRYDAVLHQTLRLRMHEVWVRLLISSWIGKVSLTVSRQSTPAQGWYGMCPTTLQEAIRVSERGHYQASLDTTAHTSRT